MASSWPVSQVALDKAKSNYTLNVRRQQVFGADFAFDPVWNMLLDLYIAMASSRRLSVSAVCIGSGVSSATALRHLKLLRQAGLIERFADKRDRRRTFVELTETGWAKMTSILDN